MTPAISPVDQFLVSFSSIVLEAIPFIILGALISGILEELLPQQLFARIIPKRRWMAIAASCLLGLIFPMCECGIVPVMRRLLGKGLPLGCAVSYMLAAPIINIVVLSSTWAAFSGNRTGLDDLTSFQMVTLRAGLAFIIAFVVGNIINRLADKHGTENLVHASVKVRSLDTVDEGQERRTTMQRLSNISQTALHDFVDITCFLILGALLASAMQTFNLAERLVDWMKNPILGAGIMMVLAILLCLCSEADAFVAANMYKVPLAGKLGFLVLGPMFDLKLLFMYTRVFKLRLIRTIVLSVFILVFLVSVGSHYLNEAANRSIAPATSPTSAIEKK